MARPKSIIMSKRTSISGARSANSRAAWPDRPLRVVAEVRECGAAMSRLPSLYVFDRRARREGVNPIWEKLRDDRCQQVQVGGERNSHHVSGAAGAALASLHARNLYVGDARSERRVLRRLDDRIHARESTAGIVGVGQMIAGGREAGRLLDGVLHAYLDEEQAGVIDYSADEEKKQRRDDGKFEHRLAGHRAESASSPCRRCQRRDFTCLSMRGGGARQEIVSHGFRCPCRFDVCESYSPINLKLCDVIIA